MAKSWEISEGIGIHSSHLIEGTTTGKWKTDRNRQTLVDAIWRSLRAFLKRGRPEIVDAGHPAHQSTLPLLTEHLSSNAYGLEVAVDNLLYVRAITACHRDRDRH